MKFVTLDDGGCGRAGVVLPSGEILDLVKATQAGGLEAWLPGTVKGIIAAGRDGLHIVEQIVERAIGSHRERLLRARAILAATAPCLAPLPDPHMIYGIGANYKAHTDEMDVPGPPHPTVFIKSPNALLAAGATIHLPVDVPSKVDFEGELACVIGHPCHRVTPDEALDYVAGYLASNDISARDWIDPVFAATDPWEARWTWDQNLLGKQFDGFAPMGPWLVTRDEVGPLDDIRLITRLNGEMMQDAKVADVFFDVPYIVSYLSRWYRLEPGDIILTGTPAGVGISRSPALFMKPGDCVEVDLGPLGTLRNTIALPLPNDQ